MEKEEEWGESKHREDNERKINWERRGNEKAMKRERKKTRA